MQEVINSQLKIYTCQYGRMDITEICQRVTHLKDYLNLNILSRVLYGYFINPLFLILFP